MDEVNYITGLQKFEGMSLREISRKTGRHFDTVKKYVDKTDWNEEVKPRKQKGSRLDPLKPTIDEWLETDLKLPRKQHHTGVRVFKRLQDEHGDLLTVGVQTVIHYVVSKKKELCKSSFDTAIKGYHPAGQAQVDFGEAYIYDEKDELKKMYELVVSFPYSNAAYSQLCNSQNQECLLEAMQRIFEHAGGVPTRILFDNMSTAVAKILPKRQRKLADGFSRFVLHHRFNAVFCNPNKGQEKGHVEGKIGYNRRNFLVPIPKVTDIDEFNERLLQTCDEDMKREHYEKKEQIAELFEMDRQSLLPLPAVRFKITRLEKATTDNYSFVRFENNRYSTAPEYNRCEVWLEISADDIRILNEKYEEISTHQRHYEIVGEPIIDWLKYLTAITRKPNAFKYTAFFKTLPPIWQNYFNDSDFDSSKKMLTAIAPLIAEGKLDDATAVMELTNVKDADSFLASYRSITELNKPIREVVTGNTPKQTPYTQDLSVYSVFMNGGAQ